MPKYDRYQDYVIRGGKLVGEFDQMYQDFEDPWHQSKKELWATDKIVGIHLLEKARAVGGRRRVVEFGCGLGHYTKRIHQHDFDVLGIDISRTAIERAKAANIGPEFLVADILDLERYKGFGPEILVLPEVTWYVLDKLKDFVQLARTEMPEAWILHLLTTYPPGVQQYGREYFTDLDGILEFFGMTYLECGEVRQPDLSRRTWFLGTWSPTDLELWNN